MCPRGHYGSISHNVKAIYQRYLGWFDGSAHRGVHRGIPECLLSPSKSRDHRRHVVTAGQKRGRHLPSTHCCLPKIGRPLKNSCMMRFVALDGRWPSLSEAERALKLHSGQYEANMNPGRLNLPSRVRQLAELFLHASPYQRLWTVTPPTY